MSEIRLYAVCILIVAVMFGLAFFLPYSPFTMTTMKSQEEKKHTPAKEEPKTEPKPTSAADFAPSVPAKVAVMNQPDYSADLSAIRTYAGYSLLLFGLAICGLVADRLNFFAWVSRLRIMPAATEPKKKTTPQSVSAEEHEPS